MVGNFLNVWVEEDGRIIEKASISIQSYKGRVSVRGTYYSAEVAKYSDGRVVDTNQVPCISAINYSFDTSQNAQVFLDNTLEELQEKYPSTKIWGRAKFGPRYFVDGKWFNNNGS